MNIVAIIKTVECAFQCTVPLRSNVFFSIVSHVIVVVVFHNSDYMLGEMWLINFATCDVLSSQTKHKMVKHLNSYEIMIEKLKFYKNDVCIIYFNHFIYKTCKYVAFKLTR